MLVGPDEVRFVVHEALLTHHSPFFRAALTGKFKEAEEKVVRLPEEQPSVVESFVYWVYHQRFPSKKWGDAVELIKTFARYILELHIFSDKYDVPELGNETLGFFLYQYSDAAFIPNQSDIQRGFNALPDTSG